MTPGLQRGLLIALPASLLLWAGIVVGLFWLFGDIEA